MTNNGVHPAVEAFLIADDKRVCHEWAKWDGTPAHGHVINDAQCARIEAVKRVAWGIQP